MWFFNVFHISTNLTIEDKNGCYRLYSNLWLAGFSGMFFGNGPLGLGIMIGCGIGLVVYWLFVAIGPEHFFDFLSAIFDCFD